MRIFFTFTLALAILCGQAAFANSDGLHWYNGPKSTCRSLQKALTREGVIVILTSEENETYFRPVREPSLCLHLEYGVRASTKTRDNPSCWVGYNCKPYAPIF